MKLFITLVLLAFYGSYNCNAQIVTEIEFSEGWIYTDLIRKNKSPGLSFWNGYNLQTDVTFWASSQKFKRIHPRVGVSYTNFWSLVAPKLRDYGHYAGLKVGVDIQSKKQNLKFAIQSSNYFLLNQGPEDIETFESENRFYANIDLGIRYKLSKRFELSMLTPVTIRPMHYLEGFGTIGQAINPVWVETIGLNIGMKYSFNTVND